jgi:hypothetical protein
MRFSFLIVVPKYLNCPHFQNICYLSYKIYFSYSACFICRLIDSFRDTLTDRLGVTNYLTNRVIYKLMERQVSPAILIEWQTWKHTE